MIMEAETYHDMLFAKWKTRRANGVFQSESEGMRTRRAIGISPTPSPGAVLRTGQEMMDILAQAKKANSALHCIFILFRPTVDCMMPLALVRAIFFTQSTDFNNYFL